MTCVQKTWGYEVWIVNRAYCGKMLHVRNGFRCSLHYHLKKDETFHILEGRVLIEVGDTRGEAMEAETFHVPPGVVHRFTGLEDSTILEFSTHHDEEDSHRLEPSGRTP